MNNDIRIDNFLYPYIRFFNAAPNAQRVDFYSGNSLMAQGIDFGDFSKYIKLDKGRHEFKITKAGDKNTVYSNLTMDISDGEVNTLAAVNNGNSVNGYAINEPTKREDLQYGHVRICQLSPNLNNLDVSANQYDILKGINYLEVSNYINMLPGKYDIMIKDGNTGNAILNIPRQNVYSGKYNTIYIIGYENQDPKIRAIFTIDAGSYNGFYL